MLAELAAFNAGFAVVKQFVANGRDLSGAFGAISKMVSAKEDLNRRHEKQKILDAAAVTRDNMAAARMQAWA